MTIISGPMGLFRLEDLQIAALQKQLTPSGDSQVVKGRTDAPATIRDVRDWPNSDSGQHGVVAAAEITTAQDGHQNWLRFLDEYMPAVSYRQRQVSLSLLRHNAATGDIASGPVTTQQGANLAVRLPSGSTISRRGGFGFVRTRR